jgi:hypothetical protein
MRGHKTRRGHKGKKRSGTKRHQRGGGPFHDQYMALLRLANKVASESKGLYADAKLKGCKGLETPLLNHFLDTEHLLVKLADFGRTIRMGGEPLTEREAFKVVRHAKADLDKMLNAGAISAEKHAREVARLA